MTNLFILLTISWVTSAAISANVISVQQPTQSGRLRLKRDDEETTGNVTTRLLGIGNFLFPQYALPYPPAVGVFPGNSFHPHPPYPGGYNQPALTPFAPYPGVVSPILQTQRPYGGYPAAYPFAPFSPNGVYGGRPPHYPNPSFQPGPASFPSNGFNPSYNSYPSNTLNGFNPSSGSYKPPISAVTAEIPDRPSGLIPDPFGSIAPVVGSPSYNSVSSGGSSYAPSGSVSSNQPNTYKPITIIESSYKPSYSPSSSSSYAPSSSSQDGYDSIIVTAQGSYDQSSSYKPSSGYKPSSSYKPSSNPQYTPYRPSSTVVGSIQEIPNGPLYYPAITQNRPTFYSGTSDKVLFPQEGEER